VSESGRDRPHGGDCVTPGIRRDVVASRGRKRPFGLREEVLDGSGTVADCSVSAPP